MDTSAINNAIQFAIKANGNNEITGPVLQSILLQIVSALNSGKEDTLVSGTDIKTINGASILAPGNLVLAERCIDVYVSDLSACDMTDETLAYFQGVFTGAGGASLSDVVVDGIFEGKFAILPLYDEDANVQYIAPLIYANINGLTQACEAYYKLGDTYEIHFSKNADGEYSVEYLSL